MFFLDRELKLEAALLTAPKCQALWGQPLFALRISKLDLPMVTNTLTG